MEKSLRWIIAGLTMICAVMIVIALLTWQQRDAAVSEDATAQAVMTVMTSKVSTAEVNAEEAQHQTEIAVAEKLVTQSLYEQDKNFSLSLLLGIEAYKTFDTPLTLNALFQGTEYQPQLLQFLADDATSASELVFSPDSKTLAVAGFEKRNELGNCAQSSLRFWDVSNGQPTRQLNTSSIVVVFSPDGKMLAVGNYDGSVILRDAATLEMIGQPLRTSDTGGISNLVFSPDGKIFASGSGVGSHGDGGPINLWDVASRKFALGRHPGFTSVPYSLAFSSDGKTFFYLGWTGYFAAWSVTTQTQVKEPQFQGNLSELGSTALSVDGKIAAFAPIIPDGSKKGVSSYGTLQPGSLLARRL